MHPRRLALVVLTCIVLAACGGDKTTAGQYTVAGIDDEPLPTPAGVPGAAVTGMPDAPGPNAAAPGLAESPAAVDPGAMAFDPDGNPLADGQEPVDAATSAVMPSNDAPRAIADNEPAAQEAIGLVRDYYAAINAQNYAQAFAMWSDGGRATGQSPQQFASGFARTNGVSVEVMAPGRIGAAAGSRYIEVPVALTATLADGSQRRYVGAYTLRRAVVDGATPEQRAWRIASADLRELQP